jgi:hypothetical protein
VAFATALAKIIPGKSNYHLALKAPPALT